MADKNAEFPFYKISEANAEVKKLRDEVADLTSKLQSAGTNDSDIAVQADALKKERDELIGQVSTLTAERDAAKKDAETARAEANTAKEKAAKATSDFEGRVKTEAAKQAGAIVEKMGIPAGSIQGGAGTISASGAGEAFVTTVAGHVKAGLTKKDALQAAIKANPNEYLAWRAAGCKPEIK